MEFTKESDTHLAINTANKEVISMDAIKAQLQICDEKAQAIEERRALLQSYLDEAEKLGIKTSEEVEKERKAAEEKESLTGSAEIKG